MLTRRPTNGGVVSTMLILNRDFLKQLMKERHLIRYAKQALHPPFWGPVDVAGNQLEFSTKDSLLCVFISVFWPGARRQDVS